MMLIRLLMPLLIVSGVGDDDDQDDNPLHVDSNRDVNGGDGDYHDDNAAADIVCCIGRW